MNQTARVIVPARLLLAAACLVPGAAALADGGVATVSTPGVQSGSAGSDLRPKVVIAVGNSESMDGLLSGAMMTGSGKLRDGLASLYASSSPTTYPIPAGFTPPATPAAQGKAEYTVRSGAGLVDNGPSRLNIAKAGIAAVLKQYLPTLDFGLVAFDAEDPGAMDTWVYHLPPADGRFAFTNARQPGARYVANPCQGYTTASADVARDCAAIAEEYGPTGPGVIGGSAWMEVSATSDDAEINDVLLDSRKIPGVVEEVNGPDPATPYPPDQTLGQYNDGAIRIAYHNSIPSDASMSLAPSNAGYVPYTPRVLFVQRGFGYYAHAKGDSGRTVVPLTQGLGASPDAAQLASAMAPFAAALAPETDDAGGARTGEIKALANQSPLAGLVRWAGTQVKNAPQSCPGGAIILVTDGLPTEDLHGKFWPPLGSAAGAGYGVYATFYGVAADPAHGLRAGAEPPSGAVQGQLDPQGSNDQALLDTIAELEALHQAGISTYVIGLGAGVDPSINPAARAALDAMAIAGGTGQVYPARDVVSYDAAVSDIASRIPRCVVPPPVVRGSVYFAYDHYDIRPGYHGNAATMKEQLKYLRAHPDASVQLQGNCDIRGSDEYNLALGQKRAEEVMKALEARGIAASRMEAISYGAERPRDKGRTEAAYAEDRRTDFAYPQK